MADRSLLEQLIADYVEPTARSWGDEASAWADDFSSGFGGIGDSINSSIEPIVSGVQGIANRFGERAAQVTDNVAERELGPNSGRRNSDWMGAASQTLQPVAQNISRVMAGVSGEEERKSLTKLAEAQARSAATKARIEERQNAEFEANLGRLKAASGKDALSYVAKGDKILRDDGSEMKEPKRGSFSKLNKPIKGYEGGGGALSEESLNEAGVPKAAHSLLRAYERAKTPEQRASIEAAMKLAGGKRSEQQVTDEILKESLGSRLSNDPVSLRNGIRARLMNAGVPQAKIDAIIESLTNKK